MLARLDAATSPDDMNLPGYRLHRLKGDLAGPYAADVSGNWRLVFRFDADGGHDVDSTTTTEVSRPPMPMKNPPHPGLTVKHDCLEPLGADRWRGGRPPSVSAASSSPRSSTGTPGSPPSMALRLAKTFGGSPLVWLHMQAAYDLAAAERLPPPPVEPMPRGRAAISSARRPRVMR